MNSRPNEFEIEMLALDVVKGFLGQRDYLGVAEAVSDKFPDADEALIKQVDAKVSIARKALIAAIEMTKADLQVTQLLQPAS